MAGTKRAGIFGLIYQLAFAAVVALVGFAATYAWARGSKDASPVGIFFVGLGIWMLGAFGAFAAIERVASGRPERERTPWRCVAIARTHGPHGRLPHAGTRAPERA